MSSLLWGNFVLLGRQCKKATKYGNHGDRLIEKLSLNHAMVNDKTISETEVVQIPPHAYHLFTDLMDRMRTDFL